MGSASGFETVPMLEFRVGAELTASIADDDGDPENLQLTWKWYRSTSRTSGWQEITNADADDNTYTAIDDANDNDVGHYLRVEASYEDPSSGTQTAELGFDSHKVRPELNS